VTLSDDYISLEFKPVFYLEKKYQSLAGLSAAMWLNSAMFELAFSKDALTQWRNLRFLWKVNFT